MATRGRAGTDCLGLGEHPTPVVWSCPGQENGVADLLSPFQPYLLGFYAADKKLGPEFPQVQDLCHLGLQDRKGSKVLVLKALMRALRQFLFYRNLLPCFIYIFSFKCVCKSSVGEQERP